MLSLCLFAVVGLSYHLNGIKCDDNRTEALRNKMGKKIKKKRVYGCHILHKSEQET